MGSNANMGNNTSDQQAPLDIHMLRHVRFFKLHYLNKLFSKTMSVKKNNLLVNVPRGEVEWKWV